MSYLSDLKGFLRIDNNDNDDTLKRLINSASSEAVSFLNIDTTGQEALDIVDTLPPDVTQAVFLLVQADFDCPPERRAILRNAAETILMPYRESLGI